MICISVTPESRKLAKVDILNASRQCDIIELCLDRLVKAPDMKDILSVVEKPILVSCRRKEDGGQYMGTEEERMTLIRSAIVAGPAYVELEHDVSLDVPRFGKTKRVIAYTNTKKPLSNTDIEQVFEEASKLNADVVKFTWPTPTLDAAWPLLAAVTKKGRWPVVGMGLGRAGVTFSLLGRKYGSPWIYAALEKGMEGYEGQPTVTELDEIYGWREINPKTQFIGILGFGDSEIATIRIFNQAFKQFDMNVRCLPLAVGSFDKLAKMLEILKIRTVVSSRTMGEHVMEIVEQPEPLAQEGHYADLVAKQDDGWHGYNMLTRTAMRALDRSLGREGDDDNPLEKKNVLVVGTGGLAQTMLAAVTRRNAVVTIVGRDENAAQDLAKQHDARYLPFHGFYDSLADLVVFADPQMGTGNLQGQFKPSYLRSSMTVIDVGHMPQESLVIKKARNVGCRIVEPADMYVDQISTLFKSITGRELPDDVVQAGLAAET